MNQFPQMKERKENLGHETKLLCGGRIISLMESHSSASVSGHVVNHTHTACLISEHTHTHTLTTTWGEGAQVQGYVDLSIALTDRTGKVQTQWELFQSVV